MKTKLRLNERFRRNTLASYTVYGEMLASIHASVAYSARREVFKQLVDDLGLSLDTLEDSTTYAL